MFLANKLAVATRLGCLFCFLLLCQSVNQLLCCGIARVESFAYRFTVLVRLGGVGRYSQFAMGESP